MDGSEKKEKEKNESIDLAARARMTFAATADIDESENMHVLSDENLTNEQMKEYLADVLEEIKGKKNKASKVEQKE
ncbi:MAG: hypothetical protein ACRD8W_01665 [Nitrososphaeraceae archaeon]